MDDHPVFCLRKNPLCVGTIEKRRRNQRRVMECNRKEERTSNFNRTRKLTDGDNQERSPIQVNFAFCFKHESNKKLTEPQSPSFMQRRRTQMNQKPLLKEPLFLILTAKDGEVKDENQFACSLSDNLSVHEQEYSVSSCDHNKKQSTNESDKPLFLTSKSKDINEELLAHRLSDESLLQEQKCAKSGHDHSMEQNISENNKPIFLTSKDTEIDEEQLAHRLSDNSSVQGEKYVILSHNHNVEKNVNEPMFSTSKDKEVDNERLEHKLTESVL